MRVYAPHGTADLELMTVHIKLECIFPFVQFAKWEKMSVKRP